MRAPAARRERWASNTLHITDVACRYLLLSILWVISCALVLTAPAGTKAMLETTREWAAGTETPVVKSFAAHFRQNAISSTAATAPLAGLGLILVFNHEVASQTGDQRMFLLPALTAAAIPVAIFTTSMMPSNLGHADSVRASYIRTLAHIMQKPSAAVLAFLVTIAAAFIIFVQPYAVLVIAAPAARLIVTICSKPSLKSAI